MQTNDGTSFESFVAVDVTVVDRFARVKGFFLKSLLIYPIGLLFSSLNLQAGGFLVGSASLIFSR